MDDALNIASSGLEAAGTILSVVAGNIANLNTPGYKARQVQITDGPAGLGVSVSSIVTTNSTVDPVAQAIEFKKAEYLYDANAAVIRIAQQSFSNLINMLDTQGTTPPQEGLDNVS